MPVTDPIGDMLTSIRNANMVHKKKVDVAASYVKEQIVKVLKEERYIKNFEKIKDGHKSILRISLMYTNDKYGIISGIKRLSSPGLRVYCKKTSLSKRFKGLGMTIVSTSKGIMSDKTARKENVGGEAICYVW
ncbi:MAG: 30S ribosomal protein S8 [bacterium]